jgi:hypothetical protein
MKFRKAFIFPKVIPMVKTSLLFLLLFLLPEVQELDLWQVLSEVGFESRPSRESGFEIDSPKFSKRLWSYNNKKVSVKGYLIPLSEMGGKNAYMLSALPFNQCYFCGGAGPETVVEVETKQSIRFVTRQITMEGILLLNDKDPDHHMYILKDARVIE